MGKRWRAAAASAAIGISVASCAKPAPPPFMGADDVGIVGAVGGALTSGRAATADRGPLARSGGGADGRVGYTEIANVSRTGAVAAAGAGLSDDGKTVSLNFVDTDVQEFVRVVFDEVLLESAIVDPGLTGRITVRTVEPVSRTAAVDLVRTVLQMNGATLSRSGAAFRVARADAQGSAKVRPGEGIRVVPLKFLDAEQARSAVQALAGDGAQMFANKGGRFLVVSGGAPELDAVEQAVASLDVDQMAGMSFALVPLQDASAQAVSGELAKMFGAGDGALKAMPIQRMNAVLLIGRAPIAVERAKGWIRRLDQAGHDGRRVFVYAVQNRRAKELATVLSAMLGGSSERRASRAEPALAPAIRPAAAASDGLIGARVDQVFADAADGPEGAPSSGAEAYADAGDGGTGAGPLTRGEVAVSADLSTNSLVVIAKEDDYRLVESAIRRLDVQPTQVLIEATIFEVQLNDSLRHGVRWFFESGNHGGVLTDSRTGGAGAVYPGFNYIFQVPKARVVLNALEAMTKLEVISSPALTVLDNETATLKVGDQVPIATRSAQSVTNPDSPVVNDIQLKDTGVILSVTPRVNASGLVQLDISQEVSDVVQTTTSSIDSPTIRQRAVNSSVAVHSGTEIVLGGLISRRREVGRSGIPLLKDIPLIGEAFTSNATRDKERTELLMIIRPIVMATRSDVFAVTQEIKARMTGVGRINRPTFGK